MKILKLERDYDSCSVKDIIKQLIVKGLMKYEEIIDKWQKNFKNFKEDLNSILEEIRFRNRINTSLEQLFERTLHLNEWIDCKVYYKDGSVINCLEIDRLVEVFDVSYGFEYTGISLSLWAFELYIMGNFLTLNWILHDRAPRI